MSDNIPFELQGEIIKRVAVKPLLKFRSVSKQWKSLIDSPEFAADYCVRHSQPHRLLLRYYNDKFPFEQLLNDTTKYKYVLVSDDDDTFQQHQIPSTNLPKSVNNFKDSRIVGCSRGLVCFYGYNVDRSLIYDDGDKCFMVVLWNPWIRKCVDVPVPNVLFDGYETIIGFGAGPQTKDLKIVKINSVRSFGIDTSVPNPWRVEVFTLSSGTWKSPSCSTNNLPCRDAIRFLWGQVALDGVIYWHALEMIKVDNGTFRHHNLIMSFDLNSEGFEKVCLPDNLACLHEEKLSIFKRMESLVVLGNIKNGTSYGVWMMEQGVTKSFTKLFNVTIRGSPYCKVHGFLKNGEPVVDHGYGSVVDHGYGSALFAYDRYSERIKDLVIIRRCFSLSVNFYMETLLLIDQ